MNLDTEQLLENPKVTSKRRYTEQQLRTLMPGFTKSKYDVDALMQRIDKAISNEKQFCEDDQEPSMYSYLPPVIPLFIIEQ